MRVLSEHEQTSCSGRFRKLQQRPCEACFRARVERRRGVWERTRLVGRACRGSAWLMVVWCSKTACDARDRAARAGHAHPPWLFPRDELQSAPDCHSKKNTTVRRSVRTNPKDQHEHQRGSTPRQRRFGKQCQSFICSGKTLATVVCREEAHHVHRMSDTGKEQMSRVRSVCIGRGCWKLVTLHKWEGRQSIALRAGGSDVTQRQKASGQSKQPKA